VISLAMIGEPHIEGMAQPFQGRIRRCFLSQGSRDVRQPWAM
jgi:hypothetical protein